MGMDEKRHLYWLFKGSKLCSDLPQSLLHLQALIVNESNLPNVYVSLEDFTLCVQVRTKSGRLESAQSSLKLIDQAQPSPNQHPISFLFE